MVIENELTSDEIKSLRNLLEVEEIKNLRLRYSYFIDARQLDRVKEVFADDAVCRFGPYGTWKGIDAICNGYKETFKDTMDTPFAGMHVNTNHLVEVVNPVSAKGKAYLCDVITKNEDGTEISDGESNFIWFALYNEEYVKVLGKWKIKVMDIHFFWPERLTSEDDFSAFKI